MRSRKGIEEESTYHVCGDQISYVGRSSKRVMVSYGSNVISEKVLRKIGNSILRQCCRVDFII